MTLPLKSPLTPPAAWRCTVMGDSSVAKLANAIQWLDEELERAAREAGERATRLLQTVDALLREFENDVDIAVEGVRRELAEAVENAVLVLREEYRRREERERAEVRSRAEGRIDEAVKAVLDELVRILEGGGP